MDAGPLQTGAPGAEEEDNLLDAAPSPAEAPEPEVGAAAGAAAQAAPAPRPFLRD